MNHLKNIIIILLLIVYSLFAETPPKHFVEAKKEEVVVESQLLPFCLIKGNRFRLGDVFNEGDVDEKPVSYVTLGDFMISTYEITVGQFEQFVSESHYVTDAEKEGWAFVWDGAAWSKDYGSTFRQPGFSQTESHPVVCVSWNDAVAFCKWFSQKTKFAVRLPTEAEWEFAAREGGMRPRYGWGNGGPSGNVADESAAGKFSQLKYWSGYNDGFVFTSPVGSFRPNMLGLYDMSGNVLEWCADSYGEYTQNEKINPHTVSDDAFRVLRGGSWMNGETAVRTTTRSRLHQSYRGSRVGFRIVREMKN
ncbi:MAG: formylglycine-generating enzyme family protein [Bacteroidota bacterium]